jgi:Ca-activated chloride channel family protein
MKARDVERRLAETPVPPPPEDLARRIIQEIPERLELSPEISRQGRVVPFRRPRTWYLAAAALVMVALTAAVTWQLRSSGPRMAVLEEVGIQEELGPRSEQQKPAEAPPAGPASRTAPRREPSGTITQQETPPAPSHRQHLRSEEADSSKGAAVSRAPSARDSKLADETSALSQPANEPSQQTGEGSVGTAAPTPAPAARDDARGITSHHDGRSVSIPEPPAPAAAERRQREPEYRLSEQPPERTLVAVTQDALSKAPPSTGGTAEPNDAPYGDVFFRDWGVNPFVDTEDDPLSTFGLEVDTGSYTVVRRYLRDGHLPPRDAVRVEEILNFFDYGDPPPRRGDFELRAEGAPSPFAHGERYWLVRFAVAAREVADDDRPPAVLVFVVDTSGSMARGDRLGLVKGALLELVDHLHADDRIGLVAYGSRGEVLAEPTTDHGAIRSAIERLQAAGSTNAEEGLALGYGLAERFPGEDAVRRVILCSDGVANVGRTGPESLLERIALWADEGIELTTVGFGMGNYNDVLMERLADTGDGRYAYVDSLVEARRIFVEELTGTLLTVAREAKAQVQFNPAAVARYRLLGYENRDIPDERFRDPTVDAGEIGAGHTVTALYEIKLHTEARPDRDRYPVATLRVRYRRPDDPQAVEIERSLRARDMATSWQAASPSLRLASLVAEYAEILKGSYWAREGDLREVLRRAQELSPEFAGDSRVADFVGLVATAADLVVPPPARANEW